MTRIMTFLALGVFFICASSCEKDAHTVEAPVLPTKLTLEQRLNLLSPPIVMFHYAYVDLQKQEESGWIIDREGNVRSYSKAVSLDDASMAQNLSLEQSDMLDLYAGASEPLMTIDLEELLARAHQGVGLSHKFLTSTEVHDEEPWIAGFYAYTQPYRSGSHFSGRGCYGGTTYIESNSSLTTDPEIKRMIVNVSGHYNRYETSGYALDLYQWLWNLEQKL